jgi:glyoxylase-like metal-dependent hydrolase (beta-lactamase superfamily II)
VSALTRNGPSPSDETFADRLADAVEGGLEGVDIVVCTHLHFDHVGWNLRVIDGQRVPTFPNARYLFTQPELDHVAVDDHMDVLGSSIQPLLDAGLVDAVDTNHRLTGEVVLIPTPGHTPGHVSVLIESQGERALITGDMAHTPLQFALPDLAASTFDWNSNESSNTRRRIVDTYANTGDLILGTHFAPPTAGRIRRAGDRVWFQA